MDIITGIETHHHNIENKTSIYQTVNYLNTIKFRVNNVLLDYLLSEFILENIIAEYKE
jgi:hypothetical protein